MLTRIYAAVWLLMGTAVLTAYLTGFLNAVTMIVFGIAFQALVFMGIIAVIPTAFGHRPPEEQKRAG
jgi:hypothetical protein